MRYRFRIEIAGNGDHIDEAWESAVEAFTQDPGGAPETEDDPSDVRNFEEGWDIQEDN